MAADLLINQPSNPVMHHYQHQQTLDDQQQRQQDKDQGGSSQLSVVAVLVTIFRKSVVACRAQKEKNLEIGWPSDVRHVAHVTFDRFNGFLGLPVEFEPEISTKPPSASTSVFGVSTKSMQLSYDSRGNSVPTILLLMQQRMYSQGGLQAEGIFRINAENTREEIVRGHLNAGVVAEGVDPHCLAGLIKAWFRELPSGILDSLSPDDIKQCQSEEDCAHLVTLLPAAERDLLDWAINLMADVVEMESFNKMNARNIAMVFAPNMTQMADPLTALVHAVHVMNFLKSLVTKTLRERKQSISSSTSDSHTVAPNEDGHESSSINREGNGIIESKETEGTSDDDEEVFYDAYQNDDIHNQEFRRHVYSNEKICLDHYIPYDFLTCVDPSLYETEGGGVASSLRYKHDFAHNSNPPAKYDELKLRVSDKLTGISNLTRTDSRPDRTEYWR